MIYSFACPFCHAEWKLEELVKVAADVFSSFEGKGTCPQCNGTFSWIEPGTMDGQTKDGKRWYELKDYKHYKAHPCGYCGRKLEGRRKYCNDTCKSMAYYRRKNPEVKRRKKVFSRLGA